MLYGGVYPFTSLLYNVYDFMRFEFNFENVKKSENYSGSKLE